MRERKKEEGTWSMTFRRFLRLTSTSIWKAQWKGQAEPNEDLVKPTVTIPLGNNFAVLHVDVNIT